MQGPTVGQPFGRYRIEGQIGAGGMGAVYAAQDTHLHRTVALKVVLAQYADSPDFRIRFQREAETLARLDSPHIITVFDHGLVDQLPYIATQYVRGGDLTAALTSGGPLSPGRAVWVCAQLADALDDAHSAGVIHRDIKPSNVLIRDPRAERWHVYLCDFGIAQDQTSARLTTAGGVVGTWSYMAPERADGAEASASSDVYALGCLLWVCLTGQAPYSGSDVSVVMAHQQAPVRRLAETTPAVAALNNVLARAMAKSPAERYGTARELLADLQKLPGLPAELAPMPLPERAAPTQPPTRGPAGRTPSRPPSQPATHSRYAPLGDRPPAHPSPAPSTVGPGGPRGRHGQFAPYSPGAQPPPPRRGKVGLAVAIAALSVVLVAGIALAVTRPWAGSESPASNPPGSEKPEEPDDSVPGAGDLDGDGLGDVFGYQFTAGSDKGTTTYTYRSNGSAFTRQAGPSTGELPNQVIADWDGDAVAEPMTLEFEGSTLAVAVPGTEIAGTVTGFDFIATYAGSGVAGDVDGDDDLDLIVYAQAETRSAGLWVVTNEAGSFDGSASLWAELPGQHYYTSYPDVLDIDQDGLRDLLLTVPMGEVDYADENVPTYTGPRGIQVLLSDGSSFDTTQPAVQDELLEEGIVVVGDYDGARTPMVAILNAESTQPAEEQVTYYTVEEDGALTSVTEWATSLPPNDGYESYAGQGVSSDVDGDGDEDLVLFRRASVSSFSKLSVIETADDGPAAPVPWGDVPDCPATGDFCTFYIYPVY